MQKEVLIEKLKSYFNQKDIIDFAYLFGSYAKNKETQLSDLDIAVYLKKYSLNEELQIIYELSKLTKKDIDLTVLNRVKNIYILEDILRDSIILKDSSFREDFEIRKEIEILDFKESQRYIDAIA